MKIVISTHQGVLYNEEIDYVVVHDQDDGEYTIMQNHIPVVSVMEEGFLKLVKGSDELFIIIVSGILEFHDNYCTVTVQEAQAGRTYESTKVHLAEARKERLERNRQESTDFTEKEKELREHIKKAKAGRL
ncbi:MAG: F0F1 ATP synthase subunit epsilon [Acholeplasmatales bacterium]|nr:F0F1 ATP synthase subunit epsilon [Acholeplasmatales bacterium]